jgi:hypothetical protein
LSSHANTERTGAETPFFPVKNPGFCGMQGLTPDLFRLVVLWHELIESTVTDPNSPDNRFILWQRNGAEITIGLLIQSLEQTLCKKYEEIMKTIIFFINILLPKQGLQHLGKNRVFYDKTWLDL